MRWVSCKQILLGQKVMPKSNRLSTDANAAKAVKTRLTCVDGAHHLLKDLEADVGDWDDASLLFLVVPIKHGPVMHMTHLGQITPDSYKAVRLQALHSFLQSDVRGRLSNEQLRYACTLQMTCKCRLCRHMPEDVGGRQQSNPVGIELLSFYKECHIGQCLIVDILLPQINMGRGLCGGAVNSRCGRDLLGKLIQSSCSACQHRSGQSSMDAPMVCLITAATPSPTSPESSQCLRRQHRLQSTAVHAMTVAESVST